MAPMVIPAIIGGIGLQAFGSYKAGEAASVEAKSQQAVANYNAQVAEQQARAEEAATAYKQRKQAEDASRYASSLRAALGASGVASDEGTPLMIQAQQAVESNLDNLMIGYEGQLAASRARSQASLDRAQAGMYGSRSSSLMAAGMTTAGTSLLTGFGDLGYKMYGEDAIKKPYKKLFG